MILLLDTSTPICRLTLVEGETRYDEQWQADRGLAKGLLGYIREQLTAKGWTWVDITAIGVFQGPGSFTGLRIGLTVLNTLADSQQIPIVGTRGDNWQSIALESIKNGQDDKIVLPFYDSEPHITSARK